MAAGGFTIVNKAKSHKVESLQNASKPQRHLEKPRTWPFESRCLSSKKKNRETKLEQSSTIQSTA